MDQLFVDGRGDIDNVNFDCGKYIGKEKKKRNVYAVNGKIRGFAEQGNVDARWLHSYIPSVFNWN